MKLAHHTAALVLAFALAACGLDTDDAPVPIAPDQLPTRLPDQTNRSMSPR